MRTFTSLLIVVLTLPALLSASQLNCEQSIDRCKEQCPSSDPLSSDSCRSFCESIACDGLSIGDKASSSGSSNRDNWIVGSATPLKLCTREDEEDCQQECRAEFDQRFRPCVDACLISRCRQEQSERAEGTPSDRPHPCIELNSRICSEDCDSAGSRAGLCRRDCLTRACPSASHFDIGQEANAPGKMACDRCKERSEFNCQTMCQMSTYKNPTSGLTSMACMNLCLQTTCGCW